MAISGLEGVVAATTQLSHVDGERGELVIAGYQVDELAAHATFEETTWLLWHGDLPSAAAARRLPRALAGRARHSRRDARAAPRLCAPASSTSWTRCAWPPGRSRSSRTRRRESSRAFRPSSRPTGGCAGARAACAAHATSATPRTSSTCSPASSRMPERVRGLETYLNTVVDHGLNASTFTARVITSTGSDLVSAVVGALGALKGPLHGGAPGPALDMVFEIGDASRAEAVLRRKIEAGEKLMGFGHRVYKVRDPRADVLAAAAERMFTRARRHVAVHAGALRRGRGASAARGVQARPPAADQRGVLHRAAPARPRIRRRRCSRRPSPSAASAAGSRTRSSSDAPTASSGRSRSTSGRATDNGCRSNSADPRVHAISKALRGAKPHP